jgi:glutaredoxin
VETKVRCDVHELAAGPDGRCVLCRTADAAVERRRARRLGVQLVLGLATALLALVGYGALRRAVREQASSHQAVTVTSETPATSSAPTAFREPAPTVIERFPPPEVPPPEPLPVASVASVAAPVAEASAQPSVAMTNPPAPAPVAAAQPTPAQIHAALVATPIVMFTASWCSVCRRAHAFLRANGLSCADRDIDADPAALRELKQRTGASSIPTLEIDGELQRPGFSERSVERALTRSVERRLGVSGIAIQR